MGTFVAVVFGAALFSVCAGLFTSAIILNGESDDDYVGAIAVFATMGAISVFASLFVVASTVSLSVEQRRPDMALLRSLGATPRQVRRLVVREIAVVSLTAAVVGTAGGVPIARWLGDVFAGADGLPETFEYRSNLLPLGASIAATFAAAWISAAAAARAAGRTSPAEAMTGAATGQQRLGVTRWLLGLLFTGGWVALVIVAATTNDDPGLAVGYVFMASATVLLGAAMLGQVVVRPISRVVGVLFRVTPTGTLAATNAVTEARRTASSATPVALMVAINVGMVQASLAAADLDTEGTQLWSLWIMIAISVGFAAIAVVNTTAMTITRRRSQLASLRLAGATPAQVRRSSEIEAAIGAIAGAVIGLVVAAGACWAFANALDLSLADMTEPVLIAGLSLFAVALAILAAFITAGRIAADPTLLTQDE